MFCIIKWEGKKQKNKYVVLFLDTKSEQLDFVILVFQIIVSKVEVYHVIEDQFTI